MDSKADEQIPRQIAPDRYVECTAEKAMKLRAIGKQERADEPPKTHRYK